MTDTNMNYVAGFMFDYEKTQVALIRKLKPKWQAGLLNGVGGKIEEGETNFEAMVREFKEETELELPEGAFRYFAELKGPLFSVDFFFTTGDLSLLKSPEEEKIELINLGQIHVLRADMIENLPWLISLALDILNDGRPNFVTAEYP